MARHCAVTGFSNGDFRLNRCRKDWCKVHNCLNRNPPCSCEPPFQLFNFPTAKKHPELRLLWCKLVNRAPSDQDNSGQQKLWTPGPKSRICSSHFVDGEPTAENPHPTLNLGYPDFEKKVQAILGKKRKTRTSTDGLSSPQNVYKQSQNEGIPGTVAKKEDELEIVGSNKNIFVPQNTVSCDKLGDTISTIDFEVTTDNQHVDSSIVTYKQKDLLMSCFFITLKTTFLLLLNNTVMLHYINFHNSASSNGGTNSKWQQ